MKFLLTFFLGLGLQSTSFGQNIPIPSQKIDQYIDEVYQDGTTSVRIVNPSRYRQLKTLLTERVFFFESEKVIEKATSLINVPLFSKYNPDLRRDSNINVQNFNPLKYQMNFWSPGAAIYRLGSSNYYILIKGQNFK